MCTVVLSLEKYLYTDFKYKDVNRLSGVNVRILLVWRCMHWASFRKNPLLFLLGLGCMRQAQLSLPVLCVHTDCSDVHASVFWMPTQASQPAAKLPDIPQGVAEYYKPCHIRAGQGYQARLLWSPQNEQSFNWQYFYGKVLSFNWVKLKNNYVNCPYWMWGKSSALPCSSGLSLVFLSII